MALTTDQKIQARTTVLNLLFPDGKANLTKPQVDSTLDTVTTWLENNAASFNTAIAGTPLASASAAVKAKVMALTAMARYG